MTKENYVTIPKEDYDKLRKAYKEMRGVFGLPKETNNEKTTSLKKSLKETYGIWKDKPETEEAIRNLRKEWAKWKPKGF